MTDDSVRNKVVLVTGAGSGLGAATARAFAAAGARVACLEVRAERAERIRDELIALGAEAVAFPCDVSDADAVFSTVEAVLARFGRIDVAVNCAGIDHILPVEDLSVAQWDRVIGVNLRGPFLIAKAVFPLMRGQGGGDIINIASTAAVRAWANASAYHASKWGLRGFSRGLSVEGRGDNIRVTTVIPGGMRTGWFETFPEQNIPLPDPSTLQDPANVAAAILLAVRMPADSAVQEIVVTPPGEPSWP